MGKYFDDRLTDEEGYLLTSEDIFDVLDIFETRDEATLFMSRKFGKSIEEINQLWEQESKEYFMLIQYRIEELGEDEETARWSERVADITFNKVFGLYGYEHTHNAAFCLFPSGRVAIVEFY